MKSLAQHRHTGNTQRWEALLCTSFHPSAGGTPPLCRARVAGLRLLRDEECGRVRRVGRSPERSLLRAQSASIESGQRRQRGSRKEGARQTAPWLRAGHPHRSLWLHPQGRPRGRGLPVLRGNRAAWLTEQTPASLPAPQAGRPQPRSPAGPPPRPLQPPARRPLRLLVAPQTRRPLLLSRPLIPCGLRSGAAPRPCSEEASGPRGARRPPTPGKCGGSGRAGGASAQRRAAAVLQTPPQGSAAPRAAPRTPKEQ